MCYQVLFFFIILLCYLIICRGFLQETNNRINSDFEKKGATEGVHAECRKTCENMPQQVKNSKQK